MSEPVMSDQSSIRPLLAYAVLAENWEGASHDLVTGLAPLFMPLAQRRAGQPFSPDDFARDLDEYYGLRISAKIAGDWVSRLEAAGLITRASDKAGPFAVFVYSDLKPSRASVSEEEITSLLNEFKTYATAAFARHNIGVNPAGFEAAFFERIVSPNFLSLIAAKNKITETGETRKLRLPGRDEELATLSNDAHLDAAVAAFIYDSLESNPARWKIIETIAAGAVLAEVVLNFQEGSQQLDFSRISIYFDAPLLMNLLSLGDNEASVFARELHDAIKSAGGTVKTFDHCIEEIKENIDGALREYEAGRAYGPTGVRLGQSTHRNYVAEVRMDVLAALQRVGVSVERFDFGRLKSFCSTDQEELLRNALGTFTNPVAQERDAASVANVIRVRKHLATPLSRPSEWQAIFVTENDRVARASKDFATRHGLAREEDVAPAITDRFLGGLIWAAIGGKTRELPRAKLIANCTAALSPGLDLVAKTSQFLAGLDEAHAAHFKAMMTDQRCGLYLMAATVGDAKLVTPENLGQLFAEVEKKVEERAHSKAAAEWSAKVATMEESHQAAIAKITRELEETKLTAGAAELQQSEELRALRGDLAGQKQALEKVQRAQAEREERVVSGAMGTAREWGIRCRRGLIAAILVIYAFALYFGADRINPSSSASAIGWQWLWIVGVPLIVAGLGFWPQFATLVEAACARYKFFAILKSAGLHDVAVDYDLDFETGAIIRRRQSGH